MKMLCDMDAVAKGYFSPTLRKQAASALALAHKTLMLCPYAMRPAVERHICYAFEKTVQETSMIGDAYKALTRKSKSFLNLEGVAGLNMAADDDAFQHAAEKQSAACERLCRGMLRYESENKTVVTVEQRAAFLGRIQLELALVCEHAGVASPQLKQKPSEREFASACRRMMCAKWWKRKISKEHARWLEHIAIKAGFVGAHLGTAYVSHTALEQYRNRRRRNRHILEGLEAYNAELDMSINLIDCVDASISNPVNRRNETMMRLRGLEEWADASPRCWASQFWTCTAPSHFHRWSNGRNNPNYNEATPRAAQKWLCAVWARVRAELKRLEIDFAGVRIAEPHHDGCPHWHMLVFAALDDMEVVERVMRSHLIYGEKIADKKALADREKRGFDVEKIDKNKGSAVGYVAKYISKHIDGKGWGLTDVDHESGLPVAIDENTKLDDERPEVIDRVLAWAALWGIRQFQFFAAGKVTAWREIRRIKDKPDEDAPLLAAWQSANNEDHGGADKACWRSFLEATEKNSINILSDLDVSAYGDMQSGIIGIECGGVVYETRGEGWQIRQKSAAWTCDNNCTQAKKGHAASRHEKKGYPPDKKVRK